MMRLCPVCNTEELKSERAKYCGNACRQKAHRQRRVQEAELAPPVKLQGLRPMAEAATSTGSADSAIVQQLIALNKALVEQLKSQQAMIEQQQQIIENNTKALQALQRSSTSANFTQAAPTNVGLRPIKTTSDDDDNYDPSQLTSVRQVERQKDNSSNNFLNSLMALQN